MISDPVERQSSSTPVKELTRSCGWVLVRVDQKEDQPSVLPHALAVAAGLGRRIKLFEVLDSALDSDSPVDPVDWDMQKREIQLHLQHLADTCARTDAPIDIQVLERSVPGEIGGCNSAEPPILAFGRHGSELPWQLNQANRCLLQNQCSSILMVPDVSRTQLNVTYGRIVVPLDGSSRAEAALPIAIAMARYHGAQLYVVHVTPPPALTHQGPLNAEDRDLERRLVSRNERVAGEYLKLLRDKCSSSGVSLNTHMMSSGDARRQLLDIAKHIEADLIILNSHGSGGFGDVLSGSVATFILEHAMLPVLMIGQRSPAMQGQLFSGMNTPGVRQPGPSMSAG